MDTHLEGLGSDRALPVGLVTKYSAEIAYNIYYAKDKAAWKRKWGEKLELHFSLGNNLSSLKKYIQRSAHASPCRELKNASIFLPTPLA